MQGFRRQGRCPVTAEIHDLLGAYVLGALDELESARFKAHLGGCARCRGEIAAFQGTSSQLDDLDP